MTSVRRIRLSARLVALFALLLFAAGAMAQSTATLQGTVTDPQGAVVPNAKVTITDAAKGVAHVLQTDASGLYQMPGLVVGTYNVKVEAPGMQTQEVKGLVLNVSRAVVQDFKLSVATGTEVVTVTGEAPMIERSTMTVGQVINEKTVQDIPLNGRHFVDLALLSPGTVTPPQNGFLTAPLRGQGSFAINTAGQREDTANFMINGINLNDMVQNQITFQPSINTVQEFKVDNSTYSAQYGRNSGSIVNIATRSGTNEFHGEVFEFLRNNFFDARNYFNPIGVNQSPFKRNNFGGDIGGPIIKNKLFFYASYEALRQRQGITVQSDVPDDPTRGLVTDPISQQLLAFVPHSNCTDSKGNAAFCGSATAPVNIDQWTGDIQYVIGDNDTLHGYYAFQKDLRQEPTLQGDTIPGFGDTRASHRQIFTLNESHVFNSNVVNEARLGFNRIHITFTPNDTTDPTSLGINDGNPGQVGLPFIVISGMGLNFGGPNGFPQGRGDATGILSDTVSWLHGRHSFKFGGEYRRFSNNNFAGDTGRYIFNSFSDFETGTVAQFLITPGTRPSRIYTGGLGLFAMDNIKLTSRFSMELGLRWDWNMSPTEAAGRFINFDIVTSSLVQQIPAYNQNSHNFQPRVGLVWDIFGNGKTVLRSGYGYMTDEPVTNVVTALASNPPLAAPLNFTAGGQNWNNVVGLAKSSLSPNAVNPNFQNAYVQNWNLNIQQALGSKMALMVGYFGSKGTHLRLETNTNQPATVADALANIRPFTQIVSNSTFTCPAPPQFPSCGLGNILEQNSTGNSNYNALWVTFNRHMTKGLQFNASYTWSHSFDYNSLSSPAFTYQLISNAYNVRQDYGPSDFDVRNRFVVNAIYDLPFKGNRLVSGWQVATILQAQGGNPIDIVTTMTKLTGLSNVRPSVVGPISIIGTPGQWFTNTVCAPPAPCTGDAFAIPTNANPFFGNMPRNALTGPGFFTDDFSLLKDTKLTERVSWQFRADIFNIFNHPNFAQPGNTASVGSSSFGVITRTRFPDGDAGSARQIQLALKLLF